MVLVVLLSVPVESLQWQCRHYGNIRIDDLMMATDGCVFGVQLPLLLLLLLLAR